MRTVISIAALTLFAAMLSGCAVVSVGATAVEAGASVASTAIGAAGDVASGTIRTVTGSSDDKEN